MKYKKNSSVVPLRNLTTGVISPHYLIGTMPGIKRQGSFTGMKQFKKSRKTNKLQLALLKRAIASTQERKYVEVYAAAADCVAAGAVVTINEIAEGTDSNERIGRKVRPKYVEYDIAIVPNATTGNLAFGNGIFHIVWDKMPNGTAAAYTAIFDTGALSTWTAFKNVASNADRFKILKSHPVSNNQTAQFVETSRVRGYIDLGKATNESVSEYPSSSAAVPNIGAFYLCYASNESTANYVQIMYGVRFVYTDM